MGWDGLAGTGVTTAQKIVQRPTPFLTRHSASRSGGVPPINNLPHDHVCIDKYTDRSDPITNTIFMKCPGDHQESPSY